MSRLRRSAALPLGTLAAFVTLVAGTVPATAAWESDYGTRATVTFGENVRARVPVTLDLPAPASGGAVTSVVAKWAEPIPQRPLGSGSTTQVSQALDVSACTADATCRVEGVIRTAGMVNGTPTITFVVSNAEGPVSFVGRTVSIDNPKPTVTFTAPARNDALWGETTLSADAAPSASPGAAALKGVRFYVDGNLSADAAYLFDDTPPYVLTLPATDIAPVLGSRTLVVVAEDLDGNLSLMPEAALAGAVLRPVTVGPPPLVSWSSPMVAGAVSGSLRHGVPLSFRAELPDTAPARPGEPADPYVVGYDVLLDGVGVGSSRYTQATWWNGYRAGARLRAIDGWWPLAVDQGLTTGRHWVTVRVLTSYGAVTALDTDVLVSDGVTWGTVTSAGRVVRDGFVVTAGTLHRFSVPVTTRVTGTRLSWVGVQTADHDLLSQGWPCAATEPASCPGSTVVRSDVWAAPNRPGTQTLTFSAAAEGDTSDVLTRTLTVQPAARLSLDVSTHLVRPGRAVRFTGRLTRLDTGRVQSGRTVYLQWRRPNVLRWRTVATRRTDADGLVRLRQWPTADGYYRLRSPEVRGTLGPGTSTEERVFLRR